MNTLQILVFTIFSLVTMITGIGVWSLLRHQDPLTKNRFIFLGESLLLGSILIIGELLTLSMVGLYQAPWIWGVFLMNLLFLRIPQTRQLLISLINPKTFHWDWPMGIMLLCLGLLFFRNSFPMIDVDSHSTYLLIQRLWLTHGTSIFGNTGSDLRHYLPCFDFVPCGLGLSIFTNETLFCEYINVFWRTICVLLVFGYTSFRMNRYYGLVATLFVLLDIHFFYSGANHWVLINAPLIALLFAGSYNFLESRRQESPFRFLLAMIFLSQVMANKYQQAYVMCMLIILGIISQSNLKKTFSAILANKRWLTAGVMACLFTCLWFLKNLLSTGSPFYPLLAGKFNVMGWTPEKEYAYQQLMGGVSILTALKYMNYFFIWPGITAFKSLALFISLFPFIIFWLSLRNKNQHSSLLEAGFWISAVIFSVIGTTIGCHQDPRYFRYGIAIGAFAWVFLFRWFCHHSLGFKKDSFIATGLLLLALTSWKIPWIQNPSFRYPSLRDNINVLNNSLTLENALDLHYPDTKPILDAYQIHHTKTERCAWDVRPDRDSNLSDFLMPLRPHVDLWFTSLVRWDSYENQALVIEDLKNFGLDCIMQTKKGKLTFLTLEEYANEAITFDRKPASKFYGYTFPDELKRTHF